MSSCVLPVQGPGAAGAGAEGQAAGADGSTGLGTSAALATADALLAGDGTLSPDALAKALGENTGALEGLKMSVALLQERMKNKVYKRVFSSYCYLKIELVQHSGSNSCPAPIIYQDIDPMVLPKCNKIKLMALQERLPS